VGGIEQRSVLTCGNKQKRNETKGLECSSSAQAGRQSGTKADRQARVENGLDKFARARNLKERLARLSTFDHN